MNLLFFPVEPGWVVLGWMLLAPALLRAWHEVRAKASLHGAQQHLWLAGVVFMAWLWTLQVRTTDGAAFGLLGAALFALLFGRALALLGLAAAVVLHTLLAGGSWAQYRRQWRAAGRCADRADADFCSDSSNAGCRRTCSSSSSAMACSSLWP